jgi:hypothetical protein
MILLIQRGSLSKAKELATTVYWDNFEYIEKPLGKELSDTVEQLLKITTKSLSQNSIRL